MSLIPLPPHPPLTWASPAPARPGAAGAGCGRGQDRRGARRDARPPTRSPGRRGPAPGRGAPAPRTGTAPRTPRTPLQRGAEVRGQAWLSQHQKNLIDVEGKSVCNRWGVSVSWFCAAALDQEQMEEVGGAFRTLHLSINDPRESSFTPVTPPALQPRWLNLQSTAPRQQAQLNKMAGESKVLSIVQ